LETGDCNSVLEIGNVTGQQAVSWVHVMGRIRLSFTFTLGPSVYANCNFKYVEGTAKKKKNHSITQVRAHTFGLVAIRGTVANKAQPRLGASSLSY
jgi:mevalonate pyrophosphate decarboxylase